MKKKMHKGIILAILTLLVISAIVFTVKAEFAINLSPLSGEPGDTIGVSSLTGDFEPLTSVGIGFGEEVAVTGEAVTPVGNMLHMEGMTANHPIKPGSFRWTYTVDTTSITIWDNGDGTLSGTFAMITASQINYTSGFFFRDTTQQGEYTFSGHKLNYTTYELDVTPEDGATTTASGYLIETVTVPSVANGNYVITAIDEMGNVGVGTLQVIPEPLTVGAIVLLSSIAVIVSFYWTRKRTLPKV